MADTGDLHWLPSPERIQNANITRYIEWLELNYKMKIADYPALHQWSVDDLAGFWESIWDYFEVHSSTPRGATLVGDSMPHHQWFEGARVNYARRLIEAGDDNTVAVEHYSEVREPGAITWGRLRADTRALAHSLKGLGVQEHDRVAAYLPNIPEALVAMLATTGIGALWSSCSPDFGVSSVLDRFKQIEPKVLLVVDGYCYGGRDFDRSAEIVELVQALPSVEHVIFVPYLRDETAPTFDRPSSRWSDLLKPLPQGAADPLAEDFDFAHPLWVVYSSGTTGLPKGMVHGHGGTLLEHLKTHSLHMNHGPGGKLFFYTTTGWIMFNLLAAALLTGCAIVQYDGNPTHPDMHTLWRIVECSRVTSFGTSPTFVNTLAQHGIRPRDHFDLSALEGVLCTGSPLTPESFAWFYEAVKDDLWVSSISGGTDVATGFVGGLPTLPVHSGEIQVHCLGVDVHAFDARGQSVIDEEGELVIAKPMPTMPLYFWNDPDGKRYHDSYFATYPGIWRHGDLLRITARGSSVISGRSDSTLNRHGIRIGTSEIYRTVEALPAVQDSLVIHLDDEEPSVMSLFVVLAEGATLDDTLRDAIKTRLRQERSPRHVPDIILSAPGVPYTLTGKKMEVPVKKILTGAEPGAVANADAMANPDAIAYYADVASELRQGSA